MSLPRIDGLYRHHKGGLYRVLALAEHSETGEELVVYVYIPKDKAQARTWARPLAMWNTPVPTAWWPEGEFRHTNERYHDQGKVAG